MNRLGRPVGFVASPAAVMPASLVWAGAAPLSRATARPTVQPGGTITDTGRETALGAPVEVRLNRPTSPRQARPLRGAERPQHGCNRPEGSIRGWRVPDPQPESEVSAGSMYVSGLARGP
jgi:hypothetical protein